VEIGIPLPREEQWCVDQLKKNIDELNLTIRRNVPSDGNCFFHCIADQLVRLAPGINQEHDACSLRRDAVNYLRNLVGRPTSLSVFTSVVTSMMLML